MNFLLLLGDLPFFIFGVFTIFVPWRLPTLGHIMYSQFKGTRAGHRTMAYWEFRFNIFLNLCLAFYDMATVLLGLLSLLSPIRTVLRRLWRW